MSSNTWRWPTNFSWNCNFSLSSFRFAFVIFAFWSVWLACQQSEKKKQFCSLQSEKKKGLIFACFCFKWKWAAHPTFDMSRQTNPGMKHAYLKICRGKRKLRRIADGSFTFVYFCSTVYFLSIKSHKIFRILEYF